MQIMPCIGMLYYACCDVLQGKRRVARNPPQAVELAGIFIDYYACTWRSHTDERTHRSAKSVEVRGQSESCGTTRRAWRVLWEGRRCGYHHENISICNYRINLSDAGNQIPTTSLTIYKPADAICVKHLSLPPSLSVIIIITIFFQYSILLNMYDI